MEGPAGTGKSRGALEKLNRLAWQYPGCRLLTIRKTRLSMTQSVMITFAEKVLPKNTKVFFHSGKQAYIYPNGSIIAVGGMDSWAKLMSSEWDCIYIAEATELNEEDLEALTTRLRNGVIPYQQLIADCNPGAPTHWLNARAMRGQMERLLSRHEDNPTVTDAYLETLRNLTGVRRARLYEGRWAASEGLVFPEYDPAIHLVNRFEVPREWPHYRVIDFGFVHPFCCQFWAIDPDGRAYMFREVYGTNKLVEDWAKDIKRMSSDQPFVATITDHDAEDRATLEKHLGCATVAARKDISPGIQAVKARLTPAGDGKPRMLFLRDAVFRRDPLLIEAKHPTSTIEEFDSYVWDTGSHGLIKEKPVKLLDEGMDCIRYMAMHLDGASASLSILDSYTKRYEAQQLEKKFQQQLQNGSSINKRY